jgi:hypothetical protein
MWSLGGAIACSFAAGIFTMHAAHERAQLARTREQRAFIRLKWHVLAQSLENDSSASALGLARAAAWYLGYTPGSLPNRSDAWIQAEHHGFTMADLDRVHLVLDHTHTHDGDEPSPPLST